MYVGDVGAYTWGWNPAPPQKIVYPTITYHITGANPTQSVYRPLLVPSKPVTVYPVRR